MLKKNLKSIIFSSLLMLLPMVAGLILWDKLPNKVPMHWNLYGEVDKFGTKASIVFTFPLILLAIHIICIIATFLDPKNKDQNKKVYRMIFFITPATSFIISSFVYASALGFSFRIEDAMMVFFGILFFFLGNYLPKCKRNYTIGIKVSWALEDEDNWNATHRFAGKLWVISSLLFFIIVFIPKISIILSLILIFALVLFPVLYSYIFYRRKNKKERK